MNRERQLKSICHQFANNQINLQEFQAKYDELFNVISGTEIVLNPREKVIMPPKQIIFKTNNTEFYIKYFPIEMKNKHYLVDILDILRQGLLPFSEYIKSRCRRLPEPEGDDVHYILKWLKQNFGDWFPIVRSGQTEKPIKDLLYKLAQLRNGLNHQNDLMVHDRLGRIPTVSTKNLDDCLKDSRGFLIIISSILGRDKIEFVLDNLDVFEQQWKAHHLWRKQRKIELKGESQTGISETQIPAVVQEESIVTQSPQPSTTVKTRKLFCPLFAADCKSDRIEPSNLASLKGNVRSRILSNLNLLCSSSQIFKITKKYLFFANQNKSLEIRVINDIFNSLYTIEELRPVHCLRIWKHKLFVLNNNSIQIMDFVKMNNFHLHDGSEYYGNEIIIPGCNHLFAISIDNNALFVMPRGGQEKYNIYWYSISNGTLLKTINIFAVKTVKVKFFRIIGNNHIIADNSFIYITEFDSSLNFKVNYKINRLIPNSILMITDEKYFIEVVNDYQNTGRIDVWEISSGTNLYSFAISSRPKIDGCFISNNKEFFSWYFLNNQLIIQVYNLMNNTENYILTQNFERGYTVEDLFLEPNKKQIITRCKTQSGHEIIHLNF